jgi:hypothetical protein
VPLATAVTITVLECGPRSARTRVFCSPWQDFGVVRQKPAAPLKPSGSCSVLALRVNRGGGEIQLQACEGSSAAATTAPGGVSETELPHPRSLR